MAKQGIDWTIDEIKPTLNRLIVKGAGEVLTKLHRGAEQVQNQAQRDAPWQDITGDARSGLVANVTQENGDLVLELKHTVEYGKWLETIQSGKYAVILPTLEKLGREVFRDAGQGLLGGGDFY